MKKILVSAFCLLVLGLTVAPVSTFAYGTLSLSQTNVSLSNGQSVSVTAYPSAGQIVNLSSISNASVVSANVANNIITIYGLTSGSSQITVCTFDSTCGTIYATVNGTTYTGGQISFSQSNVNLNFGQSMSVTIYSNGSFSNNFYISSNTNSNAVSANVSGSTLNLYGVNTGSSTITVCQSGFSCGSVYVTVGSGIYGNLMLSPSSLNLNSYQSATVSISSASSGYYISTNSNSSVASAYVTGNALYVTANNTSGTTVISVCGSASSQCASLTVTVNGSTYTGSPTFSPSSVNMNLYQNSTVSIYSSGYFGSNYFYVSNNSNPNVATATISGSTMTVYGASIGTTTMTVCQNSASACSSLFVNVTNNSYIGFGNIYFASTLLAQPVVNQAYALQLTINGGTAPYTYTISQGSLPAGMYMNNQGFIAGTPVNTTSANFTVQVRDNTGRFASQSYTMTPASSGSVLGTFVYANGTLINDYGTIYITYKNTKSGFGNMAAFTGLGYKLQYVTVGSTASLINSGFIIGSATAAHPWGSWIKNGNTVYFVNESGLIPIASYDVFLNNGGRPELVVDANNSDFGKPLQSVMTLNDTRLR